MFDYIMNGGNTEEEEGGNENVTNAITPEVEATFAETYPTWGQVLGLHNEGDEEQLIGIVKVLLSQDDGLLLTVTFEMINVLLTLVGLEIDLQDYLSGVLEPSAGIGMTPNSEYHVDINLDTGKDYRDHWVIDPATGEYVLGRYLVDKEGNFVYDENGNLIDSDTDSTDVCVCSWTPRWTGYFSIKIRNYGNVRNYYTMFIE